MTPFANKPIRYTVISIAVLLLGIGFRSYITKPELLKTPVWKSFSEKTTCAVFNHTLEPDIDGFKYCEDLIHWEDLNVVIVSCDGGRRDWNTVMGPLKNPDGRGKLYVYHLDRLHPSTSTTLPNLYPLTLERFPVDQDFHPLGLELYITEQENDDKARLFVANHRRDRSVIEVFEISKMVDQPQLKLTWIRSLTHSLLNTPNSIVALSPTSLLITNDHLMNRRTRWPFGPFLHSLETLTRFPGANVITLGFNEQDGVETGEVVIRGLAFANGLAMSPDRTMLVVASSTTFKIHFYRIQSDSSGKLTFGHIGARKPGFGPDNLSLNLDNELVVAGHPNARKLFLFAYDGKRFGPAGSAIAYLDLKKGFMESEIRSVFEDTGTFFASSSTGLVIKENRGRRLIASGLYQRGLLECLEEAKGV